MKTVKKYPKHRPAEKGETMGKKDILGAGVSGYGCLGYHHIEG